MLVSFCFWIWEGKGVRGGGSKAEDECNLAFSFLKKSYYKIGTYLLNPWMFPGNLELIEWTTTLHQEVPSKTSIQHLTSTHIEYRLTTLALFNRETVVSIIICGLLPNWCLLMSKRYKYNTLHPLSPL